MNRISITYLAAMILMAGLLPASADGMVSRPSGYHENRVAGIMYSGYCEVKETGGRWWIDGTCESATLPSLRICHYGFDSSQCPKGKYVRHVARYCHPIAIKYPCNF